MQSFLSGNLESAKSRSMDAKSRPAWEPSAEPFDGEAALEVERALFIERLRREAKRHDPERHPFNLRMLEGRLSSEEIRLWVANSYYFETRAPLAHAIVLAKAEEPSFRRRWRYVVTSGRGAVPDGSYEENLAAWERLAEATGIERAALRDGSSVLVGVRFACDAYTSFLREATLSEAVVASLAEALTPELAARRLAAFARHYSWIEPGALGCLQGLIDRNARAAALDELLGMPASEEACEACVAAVIQKSQILWHVLDCIDTASRVRAM